MNKIPFQSCWRIQLYTDTDARQNGGKWQMLSKDILETENGGQITAYVCELESLNW